MPSQPIRLAFIITDLDSGGAERALVQIVTRLDRASWNPTVLCLSGPGALVKDLDAAGIPVVCLGARRGWESPVVLLQLVKQLRTLRPALVQTFLFHANIVGRIAARLAGVRHVVSGIRVAEKRSRMRLLLDRLTDGLVAKHVCVSDAVARFSISEGGLRPETVVVIVNGVDAERFANAPTADLSQWGIPASGRSLLFVGRLDSQKAPFDLLVASEGLLRAFDDVHLLFVGDGPLRQELGAWVAQRSLQQRVHFAGWQPDVAPLMKAADCLVLTSHWEGLPNVILEAMAAGLPVVATDVEGVDELVRNGTNGLVVPPSSPDALREAIVAILSDPSRVRSMGDESQRIVVNEFTWGSVAKRYDDLYRRLLSQAAPNSPR